MRRMQNNIWLTYDFVWIQAPSLSSAICCYQYFPTPRHKGWYPSLNQTDWPSMSRTCHVSVCSSILQILAALGFRFTFSRLSSSVCECWPESSPFVFCSHCSCIRHCWSSQTNNSILCYILCKRYLHVVECSPFRIITFDWLMYHVYLILCENLFQCLVSVFFRSALQTDFRAINSHTCYWNLDIEWNSTSFGFKIL